MKTRIYAQFSKEYMNEKAIALGLSDKAANYFMYFNELAIDLEFDKDTGEVISASIPKKGKGKTK